MMFSVWLPLLTQLVVPLVLLAWLGLGRPASRTAVVLRALLVGSYIAAAGTGGMWLVLPWYTSMIYAVLFMLALIRSSLRWRTLPELPPTPRLSAGTALVGGVLALSLVLVAYLFAGWRPPAQTVELSFPLHGGPYLIVNGGANELINAHLGTLKGEKFRPWRGQSYGVDIVKLDHWGLRARGILPSNPTRYAIFGESIYSPCTGQVITAVDGIADMPPPRTDRTHMAGNHIIFRCGNVWILLGHMQRGSVQVHAGDKVAVGQPVGRVGNTGNTGEPHLHIHAQLPGTTDTPLSGTPLAIRFGSRYPVRNGRFMMESSTDESSIISVRPSLAAWTERTRRLW